jgi:hypothetical protein
MPKRKPQLTQVVGRVEDIQLPPGSLKSRTKSRAVSLLVRTSGTDGEQFEWLTVAKPIRERVYALAQQERTLIGLTFEFIVDEVGAIVEFRACR